MSEYERHKDLFPPESAEELRNRARAVIQTPTPEQWTAAKFWVAFCMALLATAGVTFTDGTLAKVIGIASAFLTSGFVYLWPNERK